MGDEQEVAELMQVLHICSSSRSNRTVRLRCKNTLAKRLVQLVEARSMAVESLRACRRAKGFKILSVVLGSVLAIAATLLGVAESDIHLNNYIFRANILHWVGV